MLTTEQAEKQIKNWLLDGALEADTPIEVLAPRLKKLSTKLRHIAYGLNGVDRNGTEDFEDADADKFLERQVVALGKLSAADRKKLLTALFGKLAGDVEHALKWVTKTRLLGRSCGFLREKPSKQDIATGQFLFLQRISSLSYFDPSIVTIEWFATWIGHLRFGWKIRLSYSETSHKLLAAAINRGGKSGKAVLDILLQSMSKDHEIGIPGDHVNRTLLMASNPKGWEAVEKLLLAAQRQEGVRQSILDSMPSADPTAIKRMVAIMSENNLTRYSSVIHGINAWFGTAWEAKDSKKANKVLVKFSEMLDKPTVAKKAIAGEDPELAYFGLWAIGISDAEASIKLAHTLTQHKDPEFRYVAAMYAANLDSESANTLRIELIGDEDLRVVGSVIARGSVMGSYHPRLRVVKKQQMEKLFKNVEFQLDRVSKKGVNLPACVWPWTASKLKRNDIADLLFQVHNHDRSMEPLPLVRLKDFMPMMSPYGRDWLIRQFAATKKWNSETRAFMFESIGDKSADASDSALSAIQKLKLTSDEAQILESYLNRTSVGIRQGIFDLLLNQNDQIAFASTERLLGDGVKLRRLAGLELLRRLAEDNRDREQCTKLANAYTAKRKKLTKDEKLQVDAVLQSETEKLSFANCLGLMELDKRTPVKQPKKHSVKAWTPATVKLIASLGKFIHDNRDFEFAYEDWNNKITTMPLGAMSHEFPSMSWYRPLDLELKEVPAIDLFQGWYDGLPAKLKDKDGLGLIRAWVMLEIKDGWEFTEYCKKSKKRAPLFKFLGGEQKVPKTKGDEILHTVLGWLMRMNLPKNSIPLCLDIAETAFAMVPHEDLVELTIEMKPKENAWEENTWRDMDFIQNWYEIATRIAEANDECGKNYMQRSWEIEHWLDEPLPGARRSHPGVDLLAWAYNNKKANIVDVYDVLLGPASGGSYDWHSSLSELTERAVSKKLKAFVQKKPVRKAIDAVVDHLFEIEIGRGESATVGTQAILAVGCLRGVEKLRRLLIGIGSKGFKKNNSYSKKTSDIQLATFTELVEKTFPRENDTSASFAKAMKAELKADSISEERLLQLAFLAPQWSTHVGETLGWKGFDEAIYWFMAHMRYVWGMENAFQTESDLEAKMESDYQDFGDDAPEKLSRWERIIRERTNLTSSQRQDGAIDVDWFHNAYKLVSPARWKALADAAKFASSSAQAKRAELISDVLLGKASRGALVDGIKKRNLKENVRLLGMLPLPTGAKREKELIDRYEVLQAYRKYATKLSSLTRPDAFRALEIGMRNLANTAGYPDPMRLQWALEAASTADLAAGPITVSKGGVSYTLELDDDAGPVLTIQRGDKTLKSLPKTVGKDKKFIAMRERAKQVKQQASRVKTSLESAMCRADAFTGGELVQLSQHAVLWPQLQRLVLVNGQRMGYPAKGGKALRDYAGNFHSAKKSDELYIAHPHDLLTSKLWPKWQRECFNIERLQPFKQVFRELYLVSSQEKKDKTFSSRYAGHQVNRRQAFALWGRRGWSVDEHENVWKSFHAEDINVSVGFNFGWTTPLEVEGLTIENISFESRKTYKKIKLTDVPVRLFSEVMRDLDLVISVAHVGEVDPEASASTVEMRKTLLAETCQLMNLKNVKLSPKLNHVSIKGSIAQYTVHLGSGVVHKIPGGSVCLVPVHSQHRGRVFLPFADNDPRTAEVISKTLMLSQDEKIDDPILLEQILR